MNRRHFLAALGVGGLSGCSAVSGQPSAVIDAIALTNTSDEAVEMTLEIRDNEARVYTETASLSGRGGENASAGIYDPVDESGAYTLHLEYDDAGLEIDTAEHVSETEPHVFLIVRVLRGGGVTPDVRTANGPHFSDPDGSGRFAAVEPLEDIRRRKRSGSA